MDGSPSLADLREALRGRYELVRELGRGGMGAVYLARDVRLDRPVALKVLPAELATDPALRERFLRETRTAAGFSHPNIVPVHAVEDHGGLLAFAMGYVEGESLGTRLARTGPLGVRETVRLLQDVGYALAYAHGRGVVHRDIKPDNIMIERATGRALVMDFGIARAIAAPADGHGLTRVGEIVGTPEYMSPEQATGDHVDGRSDLYALGLVAHAALTGTPPFHGETTQRLLVRQLTEAVPPIRGRRPDVPVALAEAIDRCAAKEASDRLPTAEALVEALDAAQLGAPEVPLAIRLLAQELGSLGGMTFVLVAFAAYEADSTLEKGYALLDALLPGIVFGAILLARVLQGVFEVQRVAEQGYSVDEIHAGLATVADERAQRRVESRTNATVLARRRRTVRLAQWQLGAGLGCVALALWMRDRSVTGGYTSTDLGNALVITGFILVAIGVVLLVRSPLRMPLGERLFRLFWLGPPGRWAITRAATWQSSPDSHLDALPRTSGTGRTTARDAARSAGLAVPTPVAPSAAARTLDVPARLVALEQRVAALETANGSRRDPPGTDPTRPSRDGQSHDGFAAH
jgi:serine/threonine-protein kinase